MSLPPLVHRGSVKDIRAEAADSPQLIFEYSDRYSVFDWGEMPDHLPGKAVALAFMADAFFELLGQRHHGVELVDERGQSVPRRRASRFYKVQRVQVLRPPFSDGQWDYSVYRDKPTNALVPLEVIFRFGVPAGSSLLSRVGNDAYLRQLGLSCAPKPGDIFDQPIIEWSTKLESSDRYIDKDEARQIAGMNQAEFARLQELAISCAHKLRRLLGDLEVELWDGKFEFAFCGDQANRDFILVDSIGPDELRLVHQGARLSKEALRERYRGGRWHQALEQAKRQAREQGLADWKSLCQMQPPKLPDEAIKPAAMIYQSLASELAKAHFDFEIFPDSWDLNHLAKALR